VIPTPRGRIYRRRAAQARIKVKPIPNAIPLGDGWIPLSGRAAYGELAEYLPRYRQMASEAGRDLTEVPLSLTAVP
jgi:hypothetical protein